MIMMTIVSSSYFQTSRLQSAIMPHSISKTLKQKWQRHRASEAPVIPHKLKGESEKGQRGSESGVVWFGLA